MTRTVQSGRGGQTKGSLMGAHWCTVSTCPKLHFLLDGFCSSINFITFRLHSASLHWGKPCLFHVPGETSFALFLSKSRIVTKGGKDKTTGKLCSIFECLCTAAAAAGNERRMHDREGNGNGQFTYSLDLTIMANGWICWIRSPLAQMMPARVTLRSSLSCAARVGGEMEETKEREENISKCNHGLKKDIGSSIGGKEGKSKHGHVFSLPSSVTLLTTSLPPAPPPPPSFPNLRPLKECGIPPFSYQNRSPSRRENRE